jgi:pyrroloquinoline quinone biosynthesis protein D
VTTVVAGARPRLARGVRLRLDHVTGKYLLLRPEQGFELQGSALEIVRLCDAVRTVDGIIDSLTAAHAGTSRAEIAADVVRLLEDLAARGLVDVRSEAS